MVQGKKTKWEIVPHGPNFCTRLAHPMYAFSVLMMRETCYNVINNKLESARSTSSLNFCSKRKLCIRLHPASTSSEILRPIKEISEIFPLYSPSGHHTLAVAPSNRLAQSPNSNSHQPHRH